MFPVKREYPAWGIDITQHFAAHSHHPRPKVARKATEQCSKDAERLLDNKWGYIFERIVPKAQENIARLLDLSHPSQIAFAPNTHEFVTRIISCFNPTQPLSILTTSSEFMSAARQIHRLKERGNVTVTDVPVLPDYPTFVERFTKIACEGAYDLIFFSQVFFDSGFRISQPEMRAMVERIGGKSRAVIVIDGYHAFCAVPTSLKAIEDRAFYLGGVYKYAQGGEGAAFMCIPKGCTLRPENTGWFADYKAVESGARSSNITRYSEDGFRFWGSTFDPAGLYRLNAVSKWLRKRGITIQMIRTHVEIMQWYFLDLLAFYETRILSKKSLMIKDDRNRGNFLSFDLGDATKATAYKNALAKKGIIVDSRGPYLRIGFGMYQTKKDVNALLNEICSIEKKLGEKTHE